MDKSTGALLDINDAGVASALRRLPLGHQRVRRAAGDRDFTDAYAIARGPRVLFDSPTHVNALAVFTDGTRRPTTIDKYAAANVNAAGGAVALTAAAHATAPARTAAQPPPAKQRPAQPVNNTIDCKATNQVPHVPTIVQLITGSRSVTLTVDLPTARPVRLLAVDISW